MTDNNNLNELTEDSGLIEVNMNDNVKASQSKKTSRLVSVVVILIVVFIIIYLAGCYYFMDRVMPGVTFDGTYISGFKTDDLKRLIDTKKEFVSVDVYGLDSNLENSLLGTITSDDISYTVTNAELTVSEIFDELNYLEWPLYLFGAFMKDINMSDIKLSYEYSREEFAEAVLNIDGLKPENFIVSRPGYITEYQSGIGYSVVPESAGNVFDTEKLREIIIKGDYFGSGKEAIDIESLGLYQELDTEADSILEERADEANSYIKAVIDCDFNGIPVTVGEAEIASFIKFDEDNVPFIDEEKVSAFVKESAAKGDTFGRELNFKTSLGVNLTIKNGGYGWKTNVTKTTKELINLINKKEDSKLTPIYSYRGYVEGQDDVGNSYVEIDLSNQHVYVYSNGKLVVESDCVSGNAALGKSTPGGLYGLTYKTKDVVLKGPDWASPVRYWMPFNGHIGMHDADWRVDFGGWIYKTDGSHGCVNLPIDKAEQIYSYVKTNMPIICYYYPEGKNPNKEIPAYIDVTGQEEPTIH